MKTVRLWTLEETSNPRPATTVEERFRIAMLGAQARAGMASAFDVRCLLIDVIGEKVNRGELKWGSTKVLRQEVSRG